jgi:prepilin-type N-terminal cleavage/methylation domain-containing protein
MKGPRLAASVIRQRLIRQRLIRQRLIRQLCRAALRGYTIVEVMMAMAVLSVGATGVVAMQKAALLGNLRARNLATAATIASGWVERLRVDALRWRLDSNNNDTVLNTAYLGVIGNDYPAVVNPEGVWSVPAANPDAGLALVQPSEDVRGMDTAVGTEQGFCTNIRVTQILPNMIRAEVRVFWLREQGGGNRTTSGTLGGFPLCSNNPGYLTSLATPLAQQHYHFVYLSSTILRHDD